jgi:cytochrome c oxidase cbb3-type subunit 3
MSRRPQDDRREDRLLDHEYDEIREYDNPLPKWWLYILYGTILYSVLYALNIVPGIGTGQGRVASYEHEMTVAKARQQALAAQAGPVTEADLLAITHDPARLARAREKFNSTCSPCHRADGGGIIGPNLTDEYWIHGGQPLQILTTVTQGVPDKGMPAWGQVLKPDEVADLVAYVLTLQGTHPQNPKEPQGTKEAPGSGASQAGSH